jgi:hypothetical protein
LLIFVGEAGEVVDGLIELPRDVAWGRAQTACGRLPLFLMCARGVHGGCGQPQAGHDRCGREVGVGAPTPTGTDQQPISESADKEFENCGGMNIFHHHSACSGI